MLKYPMIFIITKCTNILLPSNVEIRKLWGFSNTILYETNLVWRCSWCLIARLNDALSKSRTAKLTNWYDGWCPITWCIEKFVNMEAKKTYRKWIRLYMYVELILWEIFHDKTIFASLWLAVTMISNSIFAADFGHDFQYPCCCLLCFLYKPRINLLVI